jgi:hypothetical protein
MPKYNWFCRLIKIVNVYSWTAYIALQTIWKLSTMLTLSLAEQVIT